MKNAIDLHLAFLIIDDRKCTGIIFIDLKGAFDTMKGEIFLSVFEDPRLHAKRFNESILFRIVFAIRLH